MSGPFIKETSVMKNIISLLATTGIFALSAAPLMAETVIGDPLTTSCADYMSQDDAGRLSLAMQYDAYTAMSEADKTAVEAMTDEQKGAMIAEARTAREALTAAELETMTKAANQSMVKINTNCQATPGVMVIDAMDAAM
jgi:hypothetical protein